MREREREREREKREKREEKRREERKERREEKRERRVSLLGATLATRLSGRGAKEHALGGELLGLGCSTLLLLL